MWVWLYVSMDSFMLDWKVTSKKWKLNCKERIHTISYFYNRSNGSRECSTFDKRLADMISTKQDKPYSLVVSWLRTRLSYASLRAAVLCNRGGRSSHHHPIYEHDLTLATAEGNCVPRCASFFCFLQCMGSCSLEQFQMVWNWSFCMFIVLYLIYICSFHSPSLVGPTPCHVVW